MRASQQLAVAAAILAAGPAAGEQDALERGGELSPAAFVEIYRQSLGGLGQAADGAGVERLAAAEERFPGDSPEQIGKRLTRAELDVARALANRDLETLVPVMLLHHDLAVEHRRRRRPLLVRHSTAMATLLADFYAREGASEGSRRTAAAVLSSLAGHFQAGGSSSSSPLFERALELEPGNAPALLGLAMRYEKYGGPYERVAAYLERLHEAVPEHREGRLRLAINLHRLGRGDRAAELFEELTAGTENDWIYSLAAQELARLRAPEAGAGAAVAVLEEAVRRRPDDQKLYVQLAFFHDQNRDTHAARQLAERLRAGLPPAEPARGVYNRWSDRTLAPTREELRRSARTRLPLLAEALAKTEPAGDG